MFRGATRREPLEPACNQPFFACQYVAEAGLLGESPSGTRFQLHRRKFMPTIAWFYGILVQMHYNDHQPPHFHARYGGAKAMVRLSDGVIISGELPLTAARLVRQWALARNAELQDNWQRARVHQPLEKIAGPDDDE